nr:reverse transcriptase domain-containing protein [Tanacetum cinerariifolium]
MSMNTSTFGISPDVDELKDMVKALLLDKKSQNQAPATMKAIKESSYQAPTYQDPAPKTQGVSKVDFSAYVKANDAVMRNMQLQGQNMQNQLTNLTDLLTKFVNSNNASTSSVGTIPSNTVANPRSDLKSITTRSGMFYDGPQIPPSPSFLPKVIQSKSLILISEQVNSPISEVLTSHVSAPRPNQRPSIPYPSRMQDQKLPLADLGASINLMPLSVWNKLSLPDLTPTCMTLKLADRSISHPARVAKDVYVKVGSFHFSADFVVVDFDADPQVPLILRISFFKTGRALIYVFEGEHTLHVGKEAITFNLDKTSRYSANYSDMTTKPIDIIDMACEEYSQEVLGFSNVIASGNTTPYYDPIVSTTSSTLTPFRNNDFFLEEVDAFLAIGDDPTSLEVDQSYLDCEGDILFLEAFLNDDPSLPLPNQGNYLPEVRKELKICEAKSDKSSTDEPSEFKLKDLTPHLEYAFLEGDDKFSVKIAKDLSVEEKTTLITVLKSHKRAIARKLSDINGMDPEFYTHKILMEEDFKPVVKHQRRVNPKIHDVIKQEEKSHFMVKEGIVLGHKISKQGVEVDKAKVDVMTKLPHPTTVKVLGQRQDKHFRPIHYASMTMTEAESNYTITEKEMLAVVYAFKKFRSYLIMNKSIVYTDHSALKYLFAKKDSNVRLLCWVLHLQEFTFRVIDTKGAENLAADHLSRLENPHQNVLDPKEINESFPLETLNLFSTRGNSSTPWFADFANYLAENFVVTGMSVGENRASWLDKLDDALWAFRTAYKTPIGCTPYKLVYGKASHIPIELEHKAYWALKPANFDLQTTGDHKKVQLNELHDQAYENSLIYKEKTKRLHDSKIQDRVFKIGDRVLLFNSRFKIFSDKLKSRWSGSFTISHVYPYVIVELSQPDEPEFKVNGHRLKNYFGEDVPKMVVPEL